MSDFYSELNFVKKRSHESLRKKIRDKIILNQNGLLSLEPEDMYICMYQIDSEARKELRQCVVTF